MAISIDFLANARDFLRGNRDVREGLEDVGDALDDLARGGDDAGGKLERSLENAARETERTERGFKDLSDTVQRESRTAGRDIERGIGDGLDKAGDGMNDFKDEAKSTAREGAASFSGEFSDVGDVIQETLANALSGFGPIGAAAGIAAAVGFGALYAQIEKDTEAAEERVQSMYDGMLASQSRYLNEESIMGIVSDLVQDTDKMTEANDIAAKSGADLGLVLRAMAGDADALAQVNASLTDQQDDLNKKMDDGTDRTAAETVEMQALAKELEATKTKMAGYGDQLNTASDQYDSYTAAQRAANKATNDAAIAVARAAGVIRDMPAGKVIKITADTSTFVSDVQYALDKAGKAAKGGINVKVRATNSTGKVVY